MFKRLFFVFLCVIFFISCGKAVKKQGVQLTTTSFISSEDIQKAGFFTIASTSFYILEKDSDVLYILNRRDRVLSKFKEGKFIKSYKASKGQGPGDMIVPGSLFLHDKNSIGVYDVNKRKILLFDFDLNYIKEYRCNSLKFYLATVSPIDSGFLGFVQSSANSFCVAQFDSDFNIVTEFIKSNEELNWVKTFYFTRNVVRFLDQNTIAHTEGVYHYKKCCVDLYHINSKEKFLSLKWEQDHAPTKESIEGIKNYYCNTFIARHGKYYVMNNYFVKYLNAPRKWDLLIFDLNGKLVKRDKNYPYCFINSNSKRIYFLDEENESIGIVNIVNVS